MIKVKVTFINKDGNKETAEGTLLAWFEEGDGNLVSYIVLDDGRFVTNGGTDFFDFTKIHYKEMTESNFYDRHDLFNHENNSDLTIIE